MSGICCMCPRHSKHTEHTQPIDIMHTCHTQSTYITCHTQHMHVPAHILGRCPWEKRGISPNVPVIGEKGQQKQQACQHISPANNPCHLQGSERVREQAQKTITPWMNERKNEIKHIILPI